MRVVPMSTTPPPAINCLMPCDFCARIIIAVTFQQVDDTPDAETSAQSNNEGLKNGDSLIEKCHKL